MQSEKGSLEYFPQNRNDSIFRRDERECRCTMSVWTGE